MPVTIRVRVRPYADLARFFPGEGKVRELEVPVGATIGDLLATHGLPEGRRLTIGLNDRLAQRDATLSEGDVVDILVPMSGGA